jgi:PAS domain S-box-containing protein
VELLEKEVAAAQMKDGDFIEYSFSKMTEGDPISKISFIKGIPDWKWIVGAGFYKDDIDKLISDIESEEHTEIKRNVIKIALILFLLLILSIIIARWFFLRLKRNFEVFENFFIAATEKSQKIDKSKLDYQEFHKLADLANAMINEHIKDRKIIIESELKYKNLVENQGEGIIIGDLKENLEFANPAASRILGLSKEEIIQKNLKDFVSKEEFEKIRRQTSNRIEGVSSTYELMITRPDGQQRELMITATPLFDYQKKVVGSIGIFRDITEWNQAKRQLEKNRQLLELINKILRHDLMNQLVAIQSGVNLYSRDQKKEYLEETYKKIDSSIELIRKMKELEAIEYSKHNLKPIDTDILFKKMKLMHPSIEYQISGRCMVMANESFYSVVDNIINNAIHHGGTRKINIEIERKNRNCIIKISDFGKGIPDKIKSSIFDEGFKNGTTGKSGLGLYIVKEALNIIGGSIEVVDNEPQGATFIITIKSQ